MFFYEFFVMVFFDNKNDIIVVKVFLRDVNDYVFFFEKFIVEIEILEN